MQFQRCRRLHIALKSKQIPVQSRPPPAFSFRRRGPKFDVCSHQHGVGSDHAPYPAAEKGSAAIAAMQALFRHFDPQGIMNPGKLVLP
jgi:hypothetical protein